jgi:hypothetical protein
MTVGGAKELCACPCLHTTPCNDRCACVKLFSSSGCSRCCTYGSAAQQAEMARRLASIIDRSERDHERDHERDKLIIRSLRIAVATAWILIAGTITSAVIRGCQTCSVPTVPAEKP